MALVATTIVAAQPAIHLRMSLTTGSAPEGHAERRPQEQIVVVTAHMRAAAEKVRSCVEAQRRLPL